jgi:hypothetical protein
MLDHIARAILLSVTPAQLRSLKRLLEAVAHAGTNAIERGTAAELLKAIRVRTD